MKLLDAVLMGKFCGLKTVAECVSNVENHSMSIFRYPDIDRELTELYQELTLYENEELELDWVSIEFETEAALAKMQRDFEATLPRTELDLTDFTDL